jgi:hypothetical protein
MSNESKPWKIQHEFDHEPTYIVSPANEEDDVELRPCIPVPTRLAVAPLLAVMLGDSSNILDHADLATLRAALEFYKRYGQGDPSRRVIDIHELATDCDSVTSLDDAGLDALDNKLCNTLAFMRRIY